MRQPQQQQRRHTNTSQSICLPVRSRVKVLWERGRTDGRTDGAAAIIVVCDFCSSRLLPDFSLSPPPPLVGLGRQRLPGLSGVVLRSLLPRRLRLRPMGRKAPRTLFCCFCRVLISSSGGCSSPETFLALLVCPSLSRSSGLLGGRKPLDYRVIQLCYCQEQHT